MAKEPEFKRGEKGYLKRFVNLFQNDAEIALSDFKTDVRNNISELNTYKTDLSNEIESLKLEIQSLESKKNDLNNKLTEVSDFRSTIFEGDEQGNVISKEIEGFVEEFKVYKNDIDKVKLEIEEYKKELFGYENDDGEEIAGLDHKIENLKTHLQKSIKDSQGGLDKFTERNENKQEELFHKIESLLKGG